MHDPSAEKPQPAQGSDPTKVGVPNLGKAAAKGALALAVGRPIAAGLTFLGSLGLARLISPAEFGLVSMVLVFLGFAEVFRELGLGAVAIQREELNHQQLSTLFWVNTSVSAVIGLTFAACGPLLSWFYGEPRLAKLSVLAGIAFALSGSSVQHQSALRRTFRMKSLLIVQNGALALGLIVALLLALRGVGAYALLVRSVVEAGAGLVGYWVASGFTPGKPGNLRGLSSELRFGANVTLANLLNYFSRRGDNLIVGKLFGPKSLGLYTKAYELMLLPLTQVTRPLVAIALPALSRLQTQPAQYRRAYFRIADQALLLTTPIGAFCFGCPELVIRFLLGPRWSDAAPILRALALTMLTQPLANTASWLLPSQDRSGEMLRLNVASAIVNVACFLIGATRGPQGVAWAYSSGQLLIVPAVFWYICRTGPVKLSDMLTRFISHSVAGLAGAGVAFGLYTVMLAQHPLLVLGCAGTASTLVVWLTLALFPSGRAALRDVRAVMKLAR